MKKTFRRPVSLALALALAASTLAGCGESQTAGADLPEGAVSLVLSDDGITVDGAVVTEDESAAVYTAHDIVYYEDGQDFTYGAGSESDAHTAEEAAAHTVVHITQPGTYVLSGTLSAGQIAVDLGEDAKTDPSAVVTLYLNGVDITCTVAPAVIFYRVYESDTAWVDYDENGTEDYEATYAVDTSAAGANVIIADGTENTISGSYVAKIYKPESVTLSEDGTEVTDAKKLHKYDGAFYSKMSMNVSGGEVGDGILTIQAENEGLDSELHLTINGGDIRITSGVIASGSMLDEIAEDSAQTYAAFSFAQTQAGGETYSLKNESGETVLSCTPVNAFSQLLLSSPDLAEGTYTFWQGETQLAGAEGGGMGMGGGQGGMQPPQNGELPDGSTAPADGETPPERPDGSDAPADGETPPEMPDGQQPGSGEAPTPPDGTDGEMPTPPDGSEAPADGQQPSEMPDGFPSGEAGSAETSTDFTLTAGANRFSQVGPAEADAQA